MDLDCTEEILRVVLLVVVVRNADWLAGIGNCYDPLFSHIGNFYSIIINKKYELLLRLDRIQH